jgi:hypothetical protein
LNTTVSKTKASTGVFSAYFTTHCTSCDGHAKSVRREFSDQAWAALVAWNEVGSHAVDAPLCNDCYFNFRDVLIERADEMRLMSANVAAVAIGASHSKIARA